MFMLRFVGSFILCSFSVSSFMPITKKSLSRRMLLQRNSFWSNRKKEKNEDISEEAGIQIKRRKEKSFEGDLGSTAGMMENFMQSQELAKKTSALLQELSSSIVEGISEKGNVKIFFDGQQRPVSVEINEEYIQNVGTEDLNEAITSAMQDAHTKSMQLSRDKMQSLYIELGLPSTKL